MRPPARVRGALYLILAVDLAVCLYAGIAAWNDQLRLTVWFERGFPSDMLMVRNQGRAQAAVTLELDEGYRLSDVALAEGAQGFAVRRLFRDDAKKPPPERYVPSRLVVHRGDEQHAFPVDRPSEP